MSILLVVFITNAINLIDGIDGLASGLSIVALFVYGNLFIYNGLWLYSLLAFTTIGVLLPFFYYNVFGQAERAFSVLLVPCLDVIRVVIRRVRNGKSPFLPDKTHIHHKFLAMGFTVRKAMITILFISFLFSLSNILLVSYIDNTLLFIVDVAAWTGMHMYMDKVIERKKAINNVTTD